MFKFLIFVTLLAVALALPVEESSRVRRYSGYGNVDSYHGGYGSNYDVGYSNGYGYGRNYDLGYSNGYGHGSDYHSGGYNGYSSGYSGYPHQTYNQGYHGGYHGYY